MTAAAPVAWEEMTMEDQAVVLQRLQAVLEDEPAAVRWWMVHAYEAAQRTLPKAIEYGSVELIEAGRILARLTNQTDRSDQAAMEAQIYQYMIGKMSRWTAAMSRGERVSDDTIFDLMVYATMVRKIRETGEWP